MRLGLSFPYEPEGREFESLRARHFFLFFYIPCAVSDACLRARHLILVPRRGNVRLGHRQRRR